MTIRDLLERKDDLRLYISKNIILFSLTYVNTMVLFYEQLCPLNVIGRINMTKNLEHEIFNFAEEVIRKIGEHYGEGRMGGYLCIYDPNRLFDRQQLIGEPDRAKAPKYQSFAREKAFRLSQNPDHLTSWESRDVENEQYGGAIRLPSGLIISFSGMPEAVDTAFCLMLMYNFLIASPKDLIEISERAECTELFDKLSTGFTAKISPLD